MASDARFEDAVMQGSLSDVIAWGGSRGQKKKRRAEARRQVLHQVAGNDQNFTLTLVKM
ncbi:hypothetical protein [Luteimonas saliphila]|uniref:hypothetical protein n=1 Tax=Luteimonas saliphila TaxID=2804919 RepID=UPI001EE2FB73|nr:hypothetical protein [Luteimonas saliphila]